MLIGRVTGEVVSSHKDQLIEGSKLLLVDKVILSAKGATSTNGDSLVAIDSVGAGVGDLVMLVQGSSARMTENTSGKPCDCATMAIIDLVTRKGDVVYDKSSDIV